MNTVDRIDLRLGYHETVAITRDEFNELRDCVELYDKMEDDISEASEKAHDEGQESGWDNCVREELQPLIDNIIALRECRDADRSTVEGRKLYAELDDAMADVIDMATDIERRLKL